MKTSDKFFCKLIKPVFDSRDNLIIIYKNGYDKLLYILFFYLAFQRSIIFFLQATNLQINYSLESKNYNNYMRQDGLMKFGIIPKNFFTYSIYSMAHPLEMERLIDYYHMINYNVKQSVKNIKDSNFFRSSFNQKMYLLIPRSIISFYEESHSIYIILPTIDKNRNVVEIGKIINYSETLNDRLNILNIMAYILVELSKFHLLNFEENKLKKREYILLFYYCLIFVMPFSLGTASIAEISLYSLWKFYIGLDLGINQNILLDVEALTLPFNTFYKNCFEIDEEEDKYEYQSLGKRTPYLYIKK
jgi:hypothetical protein